MELCQDSFFSHKHLFGERVYNLKVRRLARKLDFNGGFI